MLHTPEFFASCKHALKEDGILVTQNGLPFLFPEHLADTTRAFASLFERVAPYMCTQPCYFGGPFALNWGSDEDEHLDIAEKKLAKRQEKRGVTTRYWTPAVHLAAFALPGYAESVVRAAIAEELAARGKKIDFSVVSNPEFLKEGAAVDDFMKPDRIVVGADDARAIELMRELYAPFQRNHERLVLMDVKSAELTKYAANAMLATRISFMNELANLAEKLGADIELVRKGIGSDPRIGFHFLYPGVGYGGSCFPKDVQALIRTAQDAGQELQVLQAVEAANEAQKGVLAQKITTRLGTDLSGKTFALWGLAFKPNTDDMREAPSLVLIADLLARGASIRAYDPVAAHEAQRVLGQDSRISYVATPMEALDGADALAIVTEWKEFRSPDFDAIKAKLKTPVIFDGRNLYDPAAPRRAGLEYFAIGRL